MSELAIPPILHEVPAPPREHPRWRWAVHTGILAAYVLGIGIASVKFRDADGGDGPALPGSFGALLKLCAMEVVMFAVVFGLAWMFSRARPKELLMQWRGGWRPILWGAAYSLALRFALMILMMILLAPVIALKGKGSVEGLRPKTENLVDMEAIKDPAYLLVTLTAVSFVVAGFREELWRAGMIAGLAGLAPALFASKRGQYAAVFIAAVIFGLGHIMQGWGGVLLTGLLGVGLGAIMVWRNSIWEAVLAHGFFNATSFAALYLVARFAPWVLKDQTFAMAGGDTNFSLLGSLLGL